MPHECIFCKIVSQEIPANIIYEDEHIIAFPDIKPAAPVHILVVPKRHISHLMETCCDDLSLLGHIMTTIPEIAKKLGLEEDGFRIVINTKNNGGQTVYHIHWHILGGRFMTWPPG